MNNSNHNQQGQSSKPLLPLSSIPAYWARSIRQTQLEATTLEDIINAIKSDDDTRSLIEEVRAIEDSDERQNKKKETLPYFSLSQFTGDTRKNEKFASTQHLIIDIDHLNGGLSHMRENLIKDPNTFILFTSPSGDGIKIIYELNQPVTDADKFSAIYENVSNGFTKRYRIEPDHTKDVARACFFSSDSDIYVNENRRQIDITAIPDAAIPSNKNKVRTDGQKKKGKALTQVIQPAMPGDRTNNIVSLTGTLTKQNIDVGDIANLALAVNSRNQPPLPEKKVLETVADVNKRYSESKLAEVEDYLNDHYSFRYNEVTGMVEYRRHQAGNYAPLTDRDSKSIFRDLAHKGMPINYEPMCRILESDFSTSIDPFKYYFVNNPTWDGQNDYIAMLADTVTLKDPSEKGLLVDYLKRWLVGQVGCAIDPTITNQTAIIFVGGQGVEKTTWLSRLIPPSLESYKYAGTIRPDNKDALIYLAEKMLINLDELETLRRAEIGELKSMMTLDQISVRRPYGRYSEKLIRRASFVGSINSTDFLNDATGTRRFLTFEVEKCDSHHNIEMDQVYAQAHALHIAGYRHWFDKQEIEKINKRNLRHQVHSYEQELLNSHFIKGDISKADGAWMTCTEAANLIAEANDKVRVDRGFVKNLGTAFVAAGYPSKRPKGTKFYYVKRKPFNLRGDDGDDPESPLVVA